MMRMLKLETVNRELQIVILVGSHYCMGEKLKGKKY
jgi:hypothetical protein